MGEEQTVSLEDVVWIHSAAIARYGGAKMFPGPFTEAAALMESVIQRHPFVDGNKKTGVASAVYLLRRHGYRLAGVPNADLVELAVEAVAHYMDLDKLARWFEDHVESL